MRHWLPAVAAMVTALGGLASAFAGEDPTGRNGIKIGAGRLHPYLQADTHYLTNPGRLPSGGPNDMSLAVRPGLELTMPSDQLELKLEANGEYAKFLGLEDPETGKLSNFAGALSLEVGINKKGAVAARVSQELRRRADASNQTVSVRLLHVVNESGVDLDLRPGGGAIAITPGYTFFYDRYDRVGQNELLDNYRHLPRLRLAWKFLPKTAVFAETDANFTVYPNDGAFTNAAGTPAGGNTNTSMMSAALGATGSVTSKIASTLRAGYSQSLGSGDSFRSVVGLAEVRYQLTELAKTKFGYNRSFQPTALFQYVASDRFYVGFDQGLGSFAQVGVSAAYSMMGYGQTPAATGNAPRRRDQGFTASVSFDLEVASWLTLNVSDTFDMRLSNYRTSLGKAEYKTNDLFLRATARY